MIREFQGKYRWLSNFIGGVEQRYQALKCKNKEDYTKALAMSPGEAKRFGRTVEKVENWDRIKLEMMTSLVRDKFKTEPFRTLLLETGDEKIQEGNYWHDTFWGVDLRTGKGENHLGKIIMQIREELRQEETK